MLFEHLFAVPSLSRITQPCVQQFSSGTGPCVGAVCHELLECGLWPLALASWVEPVPVARYSPSAPLLSRRLCARTRQGPSFWGAVLRGDTEEVTLYLSAGQDPSEPSPVKRIPPVVIATVHSRTDVLKQLVVAGAKVNEADRHERTPLHYAAGNRVLACRTSRYVCLCYCFTAHAKSA